MFRSLKKFIAVMLCMTVFCSICAPILPVRAADSAYLCGMEEHLHAEACYENAITQELICSLTEQPGHTHSDECWYISDEPNSCPVNICGTPETEGHTHTEQCMGAEKTLVCTVSEHTHSESCFPESVPMVEQTAETENYMVTVSYGSDLTLPEGTELRVMEYPKDSDIFRQRCAEAGYELEWLLNIGLFQGETELELNGSFNVVVTPKQGGTAATDITHFAPEGAQHIEGVDEGNAAVSFETESFSDFGGGIMTVAEGDSATLQVAIYCSWNGQTIPFSPSNTISCNVGDTVVLKLAGTNTGKIPEGRALTFSGCELVSEQLTCDYHIHNANNNWCENYPTHVVTVRITATNASVGGDVNWNWNSGTYTINSSTSGDIPAYDRGRPDLPSAVTTGSVNVEALRFYNLCEGDSGVAPLADCEFRVVEINDNGDEIGEPLILTSGNSPGVMLPKDMPDGRYKITELSAPDGYMRDTNFERIFTVKDKKFDNNNIGTFINHDLQKLVSSKTAEEEDYNNRIYQVLLDAENHMRMYEMDPVDVIFVVDQSNSMLFPSGLTPTGKTITLDKRGNWVNRWWTETNGGRMQELVEQGLSQDEVYYIISDPEGSSTVWALYYDGKLGTWMYQDASYFAKAKHENVNGYQDPDEKAIFPGDLSYKEQENAEAKNERANGGSLSKAMDGSGLYKYIDSVDGNGNSATFRIYTASDPYNRLHYLEEALSNMIYELANANSQNRVTLVGFTKTLKTDVGPYDLTPTNIELLTEMVRDINTGGGTRQDIGLKTAFNNHLNNSAEGFDRGIDYTHTILITDGAPVKSDDLGLGTPSDSEATNSIYGQIKKWANQVKTKSSLMTVGLGMDNVVGGKTVLEEIASGGHFCALNDAAQLVHEMQELLFDNFRAKNEIYLYADIVDEISDSFYPIAWVTKGLGGATGRTVLKSNIKNSDDTIPEIDGERDWVLLQPGDWITLEGKYTTEGADDAAGQLSRKDDGTFYITWHKAQISNPLAADQERIAWVPAGRGESTGKEVVASDGTYDWILLNEGDRISSSGQYVSNPWDLWNYGQITKVNGEWAVFWGSNANGDSRQCYDFPGWDGTFYVKAKEDFIGGNAIDTNKTAQVNVYEKLDEKGKPIVLGKKTFKTPTVNVRLLDMNEMHSEVTVYLGDLINEQDNAPIDSVEYFWDNTKFTKLVAGVGDILNKVETADGLNEGDFYLRYALGRELTAEEWQTLKDDGEIRIEYTYDDPSSHGPVGYFTFSLKKEGGTADYEVHHATVPCSSNEGHRAINSCPHPSEGHTKDVSCEAPVEKYTLKVTYTAYELGEKVDDIEKRPEKNVHNGSPEEKTNIYSSTYSPGAEVLKGDAIKKNNIHEVHVISGAIEITKVLGTPAIDGSKIFKFSLVRVEDVGTVAPVVKTITIPAGSAGPVSVRFEGLYRGTYVITEVEDNEYELSDIEILGSTTCQSTLAFTDKSVTFFVGNNIDGKNVIAKAKDEKDNVDKYTSYIDPDNRLNGVFGAAEFTNSLAVELPITGGSGTTLYQFSGLLLVTATLIYGCALRRRNRKEAST